MKKIFITVATILALCIGVLTFTACDKKNTTEEPLPAATVEIADAEGLAKLNDYLGIKYSNYTFVLKNDIDLENYERWTPIGNSSINAFCGTLDGAGYSIKNLTIKGWDTYGEPTFKAGDAAVEGTSSFSSEALFGYTKSATVKNLTLSDVNIYYYTDNDNCYAAGLVGFNTGASRFEGISVSGQIKLSNLYKMRRIYDNKGELINLRPECNAMQYVGGIVAYSSGASEFKNITSSVYIDNVNYEAYYRDRESVLPDQISEDFEEGYVVDRSSTYTLTKPEQVLAGGVAAIFKDAEVENVSYDGEINVEAKSIYSAGVVAAAYNSKISGAALNGGNIYSKSHTNSLSGGIAALADATVLDACSATGARISAMKLGTIESLSAGNIFGYGSNLAKITASAAVNCTIEVDFAEALIGGVGGVLRDSAAGSSTATNTTFICHETGATQYSFGSFANVVSAIYGNSVLGGCEGGAIIKYTNNSADDIVNINDVYKAESVTYVNDKGKLAIRLFLKGANNKYLLIYADDKDADGNYTGNLKVEIMDEELTVLTTANYTLSGAREGENVAEAYMDIFYDGVNFKPDNGGAVTVNNRNIADYEYRSGRPTVE